MRGPDRQPWRLGPRGTRWFDWALAGALFFPAPVYVAAGIFDTLAGAGFSALQSTLVTGLLGGAQTAPLAWRRRHPTAVFAVIAAASALQAFLIDTPLWSQLAFPVATYSVARFAGRWQGMGSLAVGLLGAVVASVVWLRGFYADELTVKNVSYYAFTIAVIELAAWALGTLGRTRQAYVDALVERGERLEREAAQQAALAAIEERARIAREMHDVVAHGLTVIVVQADGRGYGRRHGTRSAARTALRHDRDHRPARRSPRCAGCSACSRAEEAEQSRPAAALGDLPDLVEQVARGRRRRRRRNCRTRCPP